METTIVSSASQETIVSSASQGAVMGPSKAKKTYNALRCKIALAAFASLLHESFLYIKVGLEGEQG